MARGRNAQLAVDEFRKLNAHKGYTSATAWKGIATLLLTCEIYKHGKWQATGLTDCIIFKDADAFVLSASGEALSNVKKGQQLATYLAQELSVPVNQVCATIGTYWQIPTIRPQQFNNLVGHAFRSLCVEVLEKFGDKGITYEEERNPFEEFPGHPFPGASERARIDIIARRGVTTVAIFSSKWRFRHDRVEFIEEGFRYVTAARRHNPNCQLYAITGEFDAARLAKLLASARPISQHGPVDAAIHFAPQLILQGTKANGRLANLRSLEWLTEQSFLWK